MIVKKVIDNWIKTYKEVEDMFKKKNIPPYGNQDSLGRPLVEVALSKVGYYKHFGEDDELFNLLMGMLDEHKMEGTGIWLTI